ncbi:tetratricopeptide repeat protein [Thermodesulfobacteriota bacterium]
MKCHQFQEYFYEYLTGRLEESLAGEVAAHVKACDACRTELEEMRITVMLLDSVKPLRPSRDFNKKVMAAIERESTPFYKKRYYKYILQGAVAAVVVLAVVTTLRMRQPTEQPPVTRGVTPPTDAADCSKVVELYNKGTSSDDLKQKELLLLEALSADCSDEKILARINNNLADCYEKQGRVDKAIALYEKAIELDSEFCIPYLSLGQIYKGKKEIRLAIQYYEEAIELMENNLLYERLDESKINSVKSDLVNLKKRVK